MKKYANAFLKWITSILEVVIALILAVTIIIMTFQLILSFQHLSDLNQYPNYDDMLTTCFKPDHRCGNDPYALSPYTDDRI